MRQREATVIQVATQIEQSPQTVLELLDRLVEKGFIQYTEVENERRYRPRLAPKRNRSVPKNIWDKLSDR
jgi:predicted transcriptional regulator